MQRCSRGPAVLSGSKATPLAHVIPMPKWHAGNAAPRNQRIRAFVMNPGPAGETTMNPDNRAIVQITIDDASALGRFLFTPMGDQVVPPPLYRDY